MRSRHAAAFLARGGLVALLMAASFSSQAAEEAAVTAFSVWQGGGQLYDTGPDQATFVGAIGGTLYIETEKGPVASGRLTCPAIVKISMKDGTQTGTGHCVVLGENDDRVYGDIACSGVFLVGCHGDFTITGGTGRFEGITGGGAVIIRSDFGGRMKATDGKAPQEASGIVYWQELKYKIP